MSEQRARLVALGAVTRPHGVRGEVRVHRFNADSDVLAGLERVWLVRGDDRRRFVVTSSRPHQDLVLMTFAGVGSREEAEALRGLEVCVERGGLPDLDDDEFYHADLIGLAAKSPAGALLGRVTSVIQYPSADCLVLTAEDGVREVPLLRPYVVEVDLEAGHVVLDHLEDFELRRSKT